MPITSSRVPSTSTARPFAIALSVVLVSLVVPQLVPRSAAAPTTEGLAFHATVSPEYDGPRPGDPDWPVPAGGYQEGCLACHSGLENATENMGPGFSLPCTFCHGGNAEGATKEDAHVQPSLPVVGGKVVPPLDHDLPYQRFVNPSNLRVAQSSCGNCHWGHVQNVRKSMMATAAGHYSGGLYQNGVVDTKIPIYGTFETHDEDGNVPTEAGAVESLEDLVIYDPSNDPSLVSTHFQAVPSQACARCHLWSRGKGYRGAVGAEGVYRADGCAACHMPYADDGRSGSADASIDHVEQGHPRNHTITKAVPTEQCLHCHHRGARIGLSFTGRAQMPPRLPSGPGVPGTTDVRFNGNYHYTDAETNPQDVHGEAGMHCIDCHNSAEIMGDGNIYGHMDQATKIECQTCHGTPTEVATLLDADGNSLRNVRTRSDGAVVLATKVPGLQLDFSQEPDPGRDVDRRKRATQRQPATQLMKTSARLRDSSPPEHPVTQVMNIVDPSSPSYNHKAYSAMNEDHLHDGGGLKCYACHTSWTSNCFGCHFQRDETQLGLNLMTGEMEVGKASTNNKVFESLKYFMLGPDSSGQIAPYIVGCHPMADVTAPDGSKILDFAMPYTVNGLSGLALQPVHPHTVRGKGEVRECVECHRSPPTLGLGSGNYALARKMVYVTGEEGVLVFDRLTDPRQPSPVATLPVDTPLAITSLPDVVEGTADYLYVASGEAGLSVYDLRDGIPAAPLTSIENIDAIDVSRVARYLYVVDEGVGVQVFDNQDPASLQWVATVPIPTAVRAVPWGIHLFVAAGEAGLVVVDISDHRAPAIVATLGGIHAAEVTLYAHYRNGSSFAARAYVADPDFGVRVVDLLPDVALLSLMDGLPLTGVSALDTYTRFVPAHDDVPSREHDYLYAARSGGLHVFDITDPDAIEEVATLAIPAGPVDDLQVASQLDPPGVDDYVMLASGQSSLRVIDVTDPLQPSLVTSVSAVGASRVLVEVQPMDRFIDEQGTPLKENSHPGTATLTREDIVRILGACLTTRAPGCGEGS